MNPAEFVCVFDASGDTGKLYDPCMFANGCDPGLICVDSAFAYECDHGSPNCCIRFCDVGDMNDVCTGEGQVCEPLYAPGMAPPGFSNVGICIVPF